MATVGAWRGPCSGDAPLHYPDFYLHLPTLAILVDAFLYTVPGAVLIPLVADPHSAAAGAPSWRAPLPTGAWLRRAVPPTLLAWLVQAGFLAAWDAGVEAWAFATSHDHVARATRASSRAGR